MKSVAYGRHFHFAWRCLYHFDTIFRKYIIFMSNYRIRIRHKKITQIGQVLL